MLKFKVLILLMLLLTMSGCAMMSSHSLDVQESDIVAPVMEDTTTMGSIYSSRHALSLYGDIKARRVGDIITIVLEEQTTATKSTSTSTTKSNDISVTNPTILGSSALPIGSKILNLGSSLESSKSFSGEGDSAQSNQLTGSISVMVTKILPNGNLVLRGKKRITLSQGDEHVVISGIVRPIDVLPNNTVLSTKVANSEIIYNGSGVLADAGEMGWLSRVFNSKWWPF